MKRKFLKEIYYVGDVYKLYTCKNGVYVDINDNISFACYNNVRDALNYIYEYSEFLLGKHILKGAEPYQDMYVTDEELQGIGEVTDAKILEIIKEREKNDSGVRYSIKYLEFLAKNISCKYYSYDKKECSKHNKECHMCNEYEA